MYYFLYSFLDILCMFKIFSVDRKKVKGLNYKSCYRHFSEYHMICNLDSDLDKNVSCQDLTASKCTSSTLKIKDIYYFFYLSSEEYILQL